MEVGRYLDLGVRMFVFLALFTFAGYGLDQWLSSYPLWLVVGAIVGAGAGMTHVVVSVLKESPGRQDRSPRSDSPAPPAHKAPDDEEP
ncbi:MAG: AtpZ/AtpI family protein [Planctomycetota bacterium]